MPKSSKIKIGKIKRTSKPIARHSKQIKRTLGLSKLATSGRYPKIKKFN